MALQEHVDWFDSQQEALAATARQEASHTNRRLHIEGLCYSCATFSAHRVITTEASSTIRELIGRRSGSAEAAGERQPADDELHYEWAWAFHELSVWISQAELLDALCDLDAGDDPALGYLQDLIRTAPDRAAIKDVEQALRELQEERPDFLREILARLHHLPGLLLPMPSTKQEPQPPGDSGAQAAATPSAVPAEGSPTKIRDKPELRSWTQVDLDAAIREYKAKRAASYRDVLSGVKAGKKGAIKAAGRIWGRNAVARALGVKARAMVTKSPAWREIAEELRLLRGPKRGSKINFEQAEAEKANEGDSVSDDVIRKETISLIRRSLPHGAADEMIERLISGEISDDHARRTVKLYTDQQSEDRAHKVFDERPE